MNELHPMMKQSLIQYYNEDRKNFHLVASMHLAGVIGLLSPLSNFFQWLTPFHILTMCVLMILPFRKDSRYVAAFCVIAVVTFLIELIGVQTGKIFGHYVYGSALGWQLVGTPLLIGPMWAMLCYSIAHGLTNLRLNQLLKALFGAGIMTLLDRLIEPIAMKIDFWNWADGIIPLQNYIAWFCISFVIIYFLLERIKFKSHPLAVWILICQFIFFGAMNVLS